MKEMIGGCCVCGDESGTEEDPLVYCDGEECNVGVHKACYGIVSVPNDDWFCRPCEAKETNLKCELCPFQYGAFKKTTNGKWTHVLCALYMPEVQFEDTLKMEPINLEELDVDRWHKACMLCEKAGRGTICKIGACTMCSYINCRNYFHATCAQLEGFLCEEKKGSTDDTVSFMAFCPEHIHKRKKHIRQMPAYKPPNFNTLFASFKKPSSISRNSSSLNLSSASSSGSSSAASSFSSSNSSLDSLPATPSGGSSKKKPNATNSSKSASSNNKKVSPEAHKKDQKKPNNSLFKKIDKSKSEFATASSNSSNMKPDGNLKSTSLNVENKNASLQNSSAAASSIKLSNNSLENVHQHRKSSSINLSEDSDSDSSESSSSSSGSSSDSSDSDSSSSSSESEESDSEKRQSKQSGFSNSANHALDSAVKKVTSKSTDRKGSKNRGSSSSTYDSSSDSEDGSDSSSQSDTKTKMKKVSKTKAQLNEPESKSQAPQLHGKVSKYDGLSQSQNKKTKVVKHSDAPGIKTGTTASASAKLDARLSSNVAKIKLDESKKSKANSSSSHSNFKTKPDTGETKITNHKKKNKEPSSGMLKKSQFVKTKSDLSGTSSDEEITKQTKNDKNKSKTSTNNSTAVKRKKSSKIESVVSPKALAAAAATSKRRVSADQTVIKLAGSSAVNYSAGTSASTNKEKSSRDKASGIKVERSSSNNRTSLMSPPSSSKSPKSQIKTEYQSPVKSTHSKCTSPFKLDFKNAINSVSEMEVDNSFEPRLPSDQPLMVDVSTENDKFTGIRSRPQSSNSNVIISPRPGFNVLLSANSKLVNGQTQQQDQLPQLPPHLPRPATPTTLEEFLEGNWVETSRFLLDLDENAGNAGIVLQLNSALQENSKMEKELSVLAQKKKHLLSVNANLKALFESMDGVPDWEQYLNEEDSAPPPKAEDAPRPLVNGQSSLESTVTKTDSSPPQTEYLKSAITNSFVSTNSSLSNLLAATDLTVNSSSNASTSASNDQKQFNPSLPTASSNGRTNSDGLLMTTTNNSNLPQQVISNSNASMANSFFKHSLNNNLQSSAGVHSYGAPPPISNGFGSNGGSVYQHHHHHVPSLNNGRTTRSSVAAAHTTDSPAFVQHSDNHAPGSSFIPNGVGPFNNLFTSANSNIFCGLSGTASASSMLNGQPHPPGTNPAQSSTNNHSFTPQVSNYYR